MGICCFLGESNPLAMMGTLDQLSQDKPTVRLPLCVSLESFLGKGKTTAFPGRNVWFLVRNKH